MKEHFGQLACVESLSANSPVLNELLLCSRSLASRKGAKLLFLHYCEVTGYLNAENNQKPLLSAYATPGIRSSMPRRGLSPPDRERYVRAGRSSAFKGVCADQVQPWLGMRARPPERLAKEGLSGFTCRSFSEGTAREASDTLDLHGASMMRTISEFTSFLPEIPDHTSSISSRMGTARIKNS